MEKEIRHSSTRGSSAKYYVFQSACMAILSFLTIVLLHQLLLGGLSKALGYDTQISFGKVVSKPFANSFWTTWKVLAMYALPTFVFLSLAGFLALRLLYSVRKVNSGYQYAFWLMVFSILFITNQFTLSPFASIASQGLLYQGIVVVANWWGLSLPASIVLAVFSILINVAFGFIAYRLVIQLSPSRNAMHKKSGQAKIILNYFLLPILAVAPVAMLLSYPNTMLFFAIMLLHTVLWLPGLFGKTDTSYRFQGRAIASERIKMNLWLPALVLILIVLIRLYL